jgi:hypothetical protein
MLAITPPYVDYPVAQQVDAWRVEILEKIGAGSDLFLDYLFSLDIRCIQDEAVSRIRRVVEQSQFGINEFDLSIFGSARTGISLSPRGNSMFRPFCSLSDIDIVLFSQDLFDVIQCSELMKRARGGDWGVCEKKFDFYVSRGWLRPDKHAFVAAIFDLARSIQDKVFDRRIKCAVALFRSRDHYRAYLANGFTKLSNRLEIERLQL